MRYTHWRPLLALLLVAASAFTACARAADAASAELLKDLDATAARLLGSDQGVHVETEAGVVLISRVAARAVHPASVTKVATTLALVRRLGAAHRFATHFTASGPIRQGVLNGNLLVQGTGDPFFVDENAALVAQALHARGVERVTGAVVARGDVLFNWQHDRATARLTRAFAQGVPAAAWRAVATAHAASPPRQPRITFGTRVVGHARGKSGHLLLTHYSQPLVPMLKALNGFSNNIFTPLAQAVGGSAKVEADARASVPAVMAGEIRFADGAGADRRNRLSPRAAVAVLRALVDELRTSSHTLADVLPVAGIDAGTLEERFADSNQRGRVVAKTGTYGDYGACALAGALRTRDHGIVYFAILNHGLDIGTARARQDALVSVLLERLATEAWPYIEDPSPAFARARIEASAGTATTVPEQRDRHPRVKSP